MLPISVTMLVKNSERFLPQVLESLSGFDEVVLLDNGSTDQTLTIAQRFPNVHVMQHSFFGFGPMRNLVAEHTRNNWILVVDSDEIMTARLYAELKSISLNKGTVYRIPRWNHYRGRLIKACGWYPESVVRLYNRQEVQYSNDLVHESILVQPNMREETLKGPLLHYPHNGIEDLIDKMQRYSTLYAQNNARKNSILPLKAFIRAAIMFSKNYFFQRGFLYGGSGLAIAVSNANGVFYKYMKLYEKNFSPPGMEAKKEP